MFGRLLWQDWGTMKLKPSDLSIRQVAIAVPILAILNWAVFQFAVLPNMSEEQRRQLYPGWISSPSVYALCFIFIVFALWFVFLYRGTLATHEEGLRFSVWRLDHSSAC